MVVSAGKKKVIATGVSGEKFHGGGVAMRVNVGPGLKITGQVANEQLVEVTREGPLRYQSDRRSAVRLGRSGKPWK